ncbi:MAG: FliA/WhiG family RNA polymerase sigma factor [Bryobacteraceae bacterium]
MTQHYQAHDGMDERERLILEHLPQVHLIAKRIHDRLPECVSLEDLVSVGVLGLIAAVDHYDPSQQTMLRTYAEYRIRGAILDSLRGVDWAPRHMRKRAKQVQAAMQVVEQRVHRQPTEEEIAAELKLSLQEYQDWLTDIQAIELENLDYVDNEGTGLLKFLSDSEDNLPSAILERSELQRLLAEAISRMPKIERTVLSLYYQDELNLREIAEVVNLHLSRISQLKAQAILRLRSYIDRRWSVPSKSVLAGNNASQQRQSRRNHV